MSLGRHHTRHHTRGGEEGNFSALTLSLMVAGDVLSWRGKVDCSIASWTEWHCLHSLSPSLLLLLLYALARSPSSSLHACWQHKLHSSAVFPHCRSRSCMSSAYLSGMGLLKGNTTSRVRVCAHPQSALLSSLLSTPPPTPTHSQRIISVKDSSQERPPPRTHNSPSPFIHFHTTAKSALRYECAWTSMRNSLLHREAISSGVLWNLSENLWNLISSENAWEDFSRLWVAKRCILDHLIQKCTRKIKKCDTVSV